VAFTVVSLMGIRRPWMNGNVAGGEVGRVKREVPSGELRVR
jgi:hypothetical protein